MGSEKMRLEAYWDQFWSHENCMGQETDRGATERFGVIVGYVDQYAVVRLPDTRLIRIRLEDIKRTEGIPN